MLQRGYRFEFEVPDGWTPSRDGSRYVYHGSANEELIVSGYLLEGSGTASEVAEAHQALLDNATRSVTSASENPQLKTFKPFREDEGAISGALRCWTIISQTQEEDIMFCQAIISSGTAILLVTFEAPNALDQIAFFRRFLKSIRAAPTH